MTDDHRPIRIGFGVCAVLMLSGIAGADQGIELTVQSGPQDGEVTLTWSGGSPPFRVHGSTDPSSVSAPENLLGETTERTWVDRPPADGLYAYHILELPCGEDPAPTGGLCPSECSGGCPDPDTCDIVCSGFGECAAAFVTCPAGFACRVFCQDTSACQDATIDCPATYPCSVFCDGVEGCRGVIVSCSDGVCELNCGTGPGCCDDALLACGTDACTANCSGTSSPSVDCGTSCSCTNDCL